MRWIGVWLAVILGAWPAAAQEQRPRIGLVLAGGGAAGLAHVGVIRELERRGLRPDCVAGASMGAIVGGLYAAGYSPDELERVTTELDWGSILIDADNRAEVHPMRRKSRIDPFSVQTRLPVGIDAAGARLAGGLVDGVKLSLMIRELTVPVAHIDDFDRLPIPFRAVATDLKTGAPVILGDGDLAVAMRASMSIPALFPPVERDGRILVDGGVSNNLPIDVARDLCADVVIAVWLPPAEAKAESVASLAGSLAQTLSIFIHARSRDLIATLRGEDLLIVPDVGEIGILDFNSALDAMRRGAEAVEGVEDQVRALAGTRPPQPANAGFAREQLAGVIPYSDIVIDYDGPLDPRVIEERMGLAPSGVVTAAELETAVQRVYGLQQFSNVSYRLETVERGRRLVVSATPRDAGPVELRFGIGLYDESENEADYTVALGASYTGLNAKGGRIDLDGSLGSPQAARIRMEQPLDYAQSHFLVGEAGYRNANVPLYDRPGGARLAAFDVETAQATVAYLRAPGDWGRFGVAATVEAQRARLDTGDPALLVRNNIDEDWRGGVRIGPVLDYDTLDDPDLPRSGSQLAVQIGIDPAPGDRDFGQVQADALTARSFGPHTLSGFASLDAEIGAEGLEPHFMGGFQRVSGFSRNELVGNVAAVAGARYYRRFGFDSPFGNEAFAGVSLEFGGAWDDWNAVGRQAGFFAGSLFGGVQTALGPLLLGLGAAEGGNVAGHFSLGYRF